MLALGIQARCLGWRVEESAGRSVGAWEVFVV